MVKRANTEASGARPVQALRDHAVELEAAIALTLAEPKKAVVHRLRSQIRRLEAQMELLGEIAAVPAHSTEARALTRRLDKLRHAASRVRDLDVQRDMLKAHTQLPQRAAEKLRSKLKQQRERRAAKLQRVVARQLPRIAAALDGLVQSLSAANGLVLPDVRLVPLIERWKSTHEQEAMPGAAMPGGAMNDDQLHEARKTAKAARYMAEGAAGSAAALRTARLYEQQQDAGGRWHDWLELAATAREHFGANHALTRAAEKQCEKARAEYVELLG